MADLRGYQPSFTAGELSPSLHARVDLAKYQVGLKKALNVFIHPHGGVSNRAGLEFVGEVKNSANQTRLVGFEFSNDQTLILEFGNLYVRFWKNGAQVLSAGLPYEVVTPFTTAQLWELVFTQEADVIYITHRSHAPRKLSRLADDNWTLTTPTFGPTMASPTGLLAVASYSFPGGDADTLSFAVTAVGPGGEESAASGSVSRLYRFQNPAGRYLLLTWNAVVGASYYRVYKTGGQGDEGFMGEAFDTEFRITSESGDFSDLAPGAADPGAPSTPTGVAISNEFGQTYRYVVSAISEATGEESLPSAEATVENDMTFQGNKNRLQWNAVTGAEAYNIYRDDNGVYGFIGRSENTSFVDENITADLADGPQTAYNPFSGAGNYPACSTFVDQRLAFASSLNNPQAVWLSQSGNYENFSYSRPRKASDGFEFRIRSKKVCEIRSMLQTKGLMLFTSTEERLVSDGDGSGPNPESIVSKNQGYRGAAAVQPVEVGNTVLFAQRLGAVIRDFSYEFAEDSFVGKDLTVMARHLFEYRYIKAWGYAQYPWSIVWVVLDNGACASLTYMKEHDVWGWSRHETDGVFEDVVVIPEGGEDVPYFVVRRTIDGVEKRYIERLHTRGFEVIEDAFFVDSGLTYSGAAADVISGLGHLEGKTVVALADGNVVRDLVVESGSVTLPFEAEVAHIGLPYQATIRTLDIDLGQVRGLGTVQGRMKSISEVTFRVERTRGIWLGAEDATRDSGKMVEYKQRSTEAWNEAIGLYTGDLRITAMPNWTSGGNVIVSQFDPLPMTILAIMPDITMGM